MLLHLPKIRERVQEDFNQASSAGFLTNQNIDNWANMALKKYSLMLMKASQGYFEETSLLNIVADTETIALPSNFANEPSLLGMVLVEKIVSGERIPLAFKRRQTQANSTNGANTGENYLPTYTFRGNNLVLEPTPVSSETAGIRILFKGLPPAIRCATATAGGNTSITLDSGADPRDDYYNGARIFIYSGTGVGQIRTISDYVGSTKVATISAAWGTNPDATSVFSTLIHNDFPEVFHELIPLFATKMAFSKQTALNQKNSYDGTVLKELETQFRQFIEERTEGRKFVEPFEIY